MADSKVAQAYYLPGELVRWVNQQADAEKRPRSFVVERALNRERKAVEQAAREAQ